MISEVDDQLGRVWDDAARARRVGRHDDRRHVRSRRDARRPRPAARSSATGSRATTSSASSAIRTTPTRTARVVDAFTENVDLMPTMCDAIGVPVPAQCDGLPLTPFLRGEDPPRWRDAAHWEFDWRDQLIGTMPHEWPWDRRARAPAPRRASRRRVGVRAVRRRRRGCASTSPPIRRGGPRSTTRRVVLPLAQAMLTWRSRHADRILADMLNEDGGIGRWPPMPAGWGRLADSCSSPRSSRWRRPACTRGWNLVAKRSADRFPALWGQFVVAGIFGAIAIAITRDLPADGMGVGGDHRRGARPVHRRPRQRVRPRRLLARLPRRPRRRSVARRHRRHRAARRRAQRARCRRDRHRHRRDGAVVDRCRVGAGAHGARGGGDDRHLHHRRQPRRPRRRRQHVRVRGVRVVCRDGEHLRRGGREGTVACGGRCRGVGGCTSSPAR